ncbi:MAG TPA: hypothetical protein PKD64_19230 [Pirellulaceae bacterium]|nr:hypothetical protein [Pirellulaceae bacterium]HMO94324.1 hypothetical protein [Pirellulaceae bacterium]HMP71592.1 hypothetical protein [Pirellulaceae bacterium]
MNISINLPDNVKAILEERAAASGKNIEAYILDTIYSEIGGSLSHPESKRVFDFEAWLEKARQLVPDSSGYVDDTRESIYAGRGE